MNLAMRGAQRWLWFALALLVALGGLLLLEPPRSTWLAVGLLALLGGWLAKAHRLFPLILLAGLLLVAASLLHPDTAASLVPYALIPLLLGWAVMGWLLRRADSLPFDAFAPRPLARINVRLLPLIGGVVLLALLAEISGDALGLNLAARVSLHAQVGMFALGVGLVTWGMMGRRGMLQSGRGIPQGGFALPRLIRSKLRIFPAQPSPLNPLSHKGRGDFKIVLLPSPTRGEGLGVRKKKQHPHIFLLNLLPMGRGIPHSGRGILYSGRGMPRPYGVVVAVAVITVVGLGLRLVAVDTTLRLFLDELPIARAARIIAAPAEPLHFLRPFHFQFAYPWLVSYIEWLSVEAWGRNFFGVRFPAALAGALHIPAGALLAWALAGTRGKTVLPIVTALLLATFPPHIHFSRVMLVNIFDPLCGLWALALLAWALRSGRSSLFALAGLMLGLSGYFHESGRLLYPVLVAGWLGGLALIGRARLPWRGVGTLALTALLVAAPMYYTLAVTRGAFATRLGDAGLSGAYWRDLWAAGWGSELFADHAARVARAFLVYTHQVDLPYIWLYYGGNHALVIAPLLPLLFVGIGGLLWRVRSAAALLILPWLLLTSLGSTLLVESAVYTRYVVVLPALALLLAVGLTTIIGWGLAGRRNIKIMLAAAVMIAAGQVGYYFADHLPAYKAQLLGRWRQPVTDDAILRAVELPAGTRVHFVNDPREDLGAMTSALHFFNDQLEVKTLLPDEIDLTYLLNLPTGRGHAFFLDPDDARTLYFLHDYFEIESVETTPYDLPRERAMLRYYIPAEAMPLGVAP
jgi:4-amino-4-deoxy-L-arabinose transferase-like glycosyltransferase